ncbi:MAG: phosphate ABC transporter permease PstA [Dehalococcoidia bacterium]|nr:phosphate ABC transporter permease PstA [Dehalococcoidia bacterium]
MLAANSGAYRRRKLVNYLMLTICLAVAVGTVLLLFLILGYVFINGAQAINLDFFTQLPKPAGEPGGGMANAIVGSLIVLAVASAFSLPIGIFSGIYLSEFSYSRFADLVRFVTETLAGVPSIVVGIFAFVFIVKPMGTFSALAGGFALAVIMIPVFSRTAEEALRTVPFSLREAALALGVPVWRVVLRVVVPSAASGLITAFMLALARAAGETAPLLFTTLGNRFWQEGVTQPIATLPVQIFSYAIGPYKDWHSQAWAGSLVLVAITLLIIGSVRLLYRGSRTKR